MEPQNDVAAKKLARLPRLLEWAYASGRHDLYRELRLLNLQLLHESGRQPPPLSKADQEAVRRGELFTDIRAWHAKLRMLRKAGHLPDVSFEIPERPRTRAQLSGRRAKSARRSSRRATARSPGRSADDPDPPLAAQSLTRLQILRRAVSDARREQIAREDDRRARAMQATAVVLVCCRCQEQVDELAAGRYWCKGCEAKRRAQHREASAVAA